MMEAITFGFLCFMFFVLGFSVANLCRLRKLRISMNKNRKLLEEAKKIIDEVKTKKDFNEIRRLLNRIEGRQEVTSEQNYFI